jgi:ATP-dependent Clp protease, protease subunit
MILSKMVRRSFKIAPVPGRATEKSTKRQIEQSTSSSSNTSSSDESISDDEQPEPVVKPGNPKKRKAPDDGDDPRDNPVMLLELKRKLLHLAFEIKALETQIPLLDETAELQRQRELLKLEHDVNLLKNKERHVALDHQKKEKIDQWEIANIDTMMPGLSEKAKRQRLETQLDVDTLEAMSPYQRQLVELYKETELVRVKTALEFERFKSERFQRVKEIETRGLDIASKLTESEWKDLVAREPEYPTEPVSTDPATGLKTLTISDRVVNLNGPIIYRTASYITDRINYFNNQDPDKPIYIVIDYSPGGSVMAGFRIIKAMESSTAPIHVVVKSFAASMAAGIATLADKSYILPNAEILHHQMLSGTEYVNMTQAKEWLNSLNETWARLAGPIAKKLGMTTEQWVAELYRHNSDADWCLFGDKAVEAGWVGQVVDRVRLTGKTLNPDLYYYRTPRCGINARTNSATTPENGSLAGLRTDHSYVSTGIDDSEDTSPLPKLRPRDFYWLYNPNNYYGTEQSK